MQDLDVFINQPDNNNPPPKSPSKADSDKLLGKRVQVVSEGKTLGQKSENSKNKKRNQKKVVKNLMKDINKEKYNLPDLAVDRIDRNRRNLSKLLKDLIAEYLTADNSDFRDAVVDAKPYAKL